MSIRTFVRNIYTLFAYDFRNQDKERLKQWLMTRDFITFENLRRYFEENDSSAYQEEIDYILSNGLQPFPYAVVKRVDKVECGFDHIIKLPFVVHNGKRLFFPKSYSLANVERHYRNFIETENLLGGGYRTKMPHCYQSERVKVENGDVFVDLGSAEGLVSLDVVDKVSKIYLVESDRSWIPALRATFAPYKDKCIIVPKLISSSCKHHSTTLSKLLASETNSHIFIKMDIEGFESEVLNASKDFLATRHNIKLAVCTYHRHNDAADFSAFFDRLGYKYEVSDGYMIFDLDFSELPTPPFFRKGMIRAWR